MNRSNMVCIDYCEFFVLPRAVKDAWRWEMIKRLTILYGKPRILMVSKALRVHWGLLDNNSIHVESC